MRSESDNMKTYNHSLPDSNPPRKTSLLTSGGLLRKSNPRRLSTKKTLVPELNNTKVFIISSIFAMVFSPFNGFQNMLHELMKENKYIDHGLLALAFFYICLGLGCFVTPQYSTKYSYKVTFFISVLPMVLFFGSQWLLVSCTKEHFAICETSAVYLISLACSAIAGLATSLLWITTSVYLTDCSSPITKGKMFGMFAAITQFTQLLGNLLACILLAYFGVVIFFEVIILLCIGATIFTLFLSQPEKQSGDFHLIVELSNIGKDSLSPDSLEDRLIPQNSDVGIPKMEYFTKEFFWKCLTMQKTTIFYPLFMASAYNVSLFVTYLAGDAYEGLTKGEEEPEPFTKRIMQVLVVFVALGLGEILANRIFTAKITTDKRGALSLTYKIFMACGILHIIANSSGAYWLYIPIGFLYGLGDGGSQLVIGGLISMKFIERFEPFTCFRIIYFISLGGFFILHVLLIKGAATVSFVIFIVLTGFAWVNNYKFFTTLS